MNFNREISLIGYNEYVDNMVLAQLEDELADQNFLIDEYETQLEEDRLLVNVMQTYDERLAIERVETIDQLEAENLNERYVVENVDMEALSDLSDLDEDIENEVVAMVAVERERDFELVELENRIVRIRHLDALARRERLDRQRYNRRLLDIVNSLRESWQRNNDLFAQLYRIVNFMNDII